MGVFVIALLTMTLIILVLLFNSKCFCLSRNYEASSLLYAGDLNYLNHKLRFDRKFFFNLGNFFSKLVSKSFLEELKLHHLYLEREENELYISLGQGFLSFMVSVFCYLINFNWIFLVLALLLPALILFELQLAISNTRAEIEENIEHVVSCLRVLVIKTETPIVTALETIIAGLSSQPMIRELNKLINKTQKSGLKVTLLEWETELPKFRDFIALLIALNEGASKNAMKLSFDNFLKKISDQKEQEAKNQAENLQLYLMGPVILMLLIESLPLMDAIRFLINNTGVLGE